MAEERDPNKMNEAELVVWILRQRAIRAGKLVEMRTYVEARTRPAHRNMAGA